jgi:hypothetical protein
MKKKLFSLLGVMVTMVAIVTSVYVNNNTNKNNEIFNANVEALADVEETVTKDCEELENLCLYRCRYDDCGVLLEKEGVAGPIKNIPKKCPKCGREQ